jgi:4-hydroxy-tetrahydrodipicolinate synthase
VGIYTAVQVGDLARARELQGKLSPVRKLFGVGSHPAGIKEAMVQLGMLGCGKCRRPTIDLTSAQKDEVRKTLRETGLL